jgi:hypothetical protein
MEIKHFSPTSGWTSGLNRGRTGAGRGGADVRGFHN